MHTLHAQLQHLPHNQPSPIPGEIEIGTGPGEEMEEILYSRTDPFDTSEEGLVTVDTLFGLAQ